MEQIILNLVPGGVSPVCYVSQYDVGRKIRLHLRNGSDPYVLAGAETVTATIRKVSGEELIYDIANTSASYVDLIVNYDATDVIGESVCELIITESGLRIGSANFKMRIDRDVYSGDQKLEVVSATSENPNLSFETNVEENLLELKAGFSPVQDLHGYDSPWIDSNVVNKKPYLMRAIAGTASRIGTHEYNKIVGGTVAFNQILKNGDFSDTSNWAQSGSTLSVNNNTGLMTATTVNGNISQKFNAISGHKYLVKVNIKLTTETNQVRLNTYMSVSPYDSVNKFAEAITSEQELTLVISPINSREYYCRIVDERSSDWDIIQIKNFNLFDLTQMFGSTIADYIYSLEQATAGAGVAWFKALFPKDYYAYNAGELMSVKTSGHKTIGKNILDLTSAFDSLNITYTVVDGWYVINQIDQQSSKLYFSRLPIPLSDNKSLLLLIDANNTSSTNFRVKSYDKSNVASGSTGNGNPSNSTISNKDISYIGFDWSTGGSARFKIMVVVDSTPPTTYEPYISHTYPLDSDLELRGVPKLDENNNLYYDGDEYASDGGVKRRYGIVDLGSLTWEYTGTGNEKRFQASGITVKRIPDNYTIANMICTKDYVTKSWSNIGTADKFITRIGGNYDMVAIIDTAYTDATTFKNSLSGNYLVYELPTEASETADPFTDPQEIDPNGSEEFVDTRSVAIPVGHESYYANICEIEGWNEMNVIGCGKNLFSYGLPIHEGYWSANTFVGSDNVVPLSNASGWTNIRVKVPEGENITLSGFQAESGVYGVFLGSDNPADIVSNFLNWQMNKTFTVPSGAKYIGLCFKNLNTEYVNYPNAQLEIGSTATDFEPYTAQALNLDWNTNQWDEEWEVGSYNNQTGEKIDYSAVIRCKNFIPVVPNSRLHFVAPQNAEFFYYDKNKNFISSNAGIQGGYDTVVPDNIYFINFRMGTAYGNVYNHDISINYPSTDHTYHPYRGHGVAYKGEVVYKDGGWKLRLKGIEYLFDGSVMTNWQWDGHYGTSTRVNYYNNDIKPNTEVISNLFASGSFGNDKEVITTHGNANMLIVLIHSNKLETDDLNGWKKFLETSNLYAVCELVTPIEIPLDQNSKLATVLGINNLMHDTNGGTEVKFFRMISAS